MGAGVRRFRCYRPGSRVSFAWKAVKQSRHPTACRARCLHEAGQQNPVGVDVIERSVGSATFRQRSASFDDPSTVNVAVFQADYDSGRVECHTRVAANDSFESDRIAAREGFGHPRIG